VLPVRRWHWRQWHCAAPGPAAIRARVVWSIARRRRVSSNSRCSSFRKGEKLCKTAGGMASAIDHCGSPSAMDVHPPPNIQVWPPLWSLTPGAPALTCQTFHLKFLLHLRPYSRPAPVPHIGGGARRVVASRQRQNQPKHNAIKYAAARFCLLSHQHRVTLALRSHGRRRRPRALAFGRDWKCRYARLPSRDPWSS
jgi:hypothetical protein